MGMQTEMTEAELGQARAAQTQRLTLVAVWVLAAVVAVLAVLVLVQSSRISDLETAVQQGSGPDYDPFGAQSNEVMDACRLLGAVAQKQGVPIATVFDGTSMSNCEAMAGEGAAAVRSGG